MATLRERANSSNSSPTNTDSNGEGENGVSESTGGEIIVGGSPEGYNSNSTGQNSDNDVDVSNDSNDEAESPEIGDSNSEALDNNGDALDPSGNSDNNYVAPDGSDSIGGSDENENSDSGSSDNNVDGDGASDTIQIITITLTVNHDAAATSATNSGGDTSEDSGKIDDFAFTNDGTCGIRMFKYQSTGKKCASGYCCSQHGWCGGEEAWCGVGCQPEFGECWSREVSISLKYPTFV